MADLLRRRGWTEGTLEARAIFVAENIYRAVGPDRIRITRPLARSAPTAGAATGVWRDHRHGTGLALAGAPRPTRRRRPRRLRRARARPRRHRASGLPRECGPAQRPGRRQPPPTGSPVARPAAPRRRPRRTPPRPHT